MRVINTFGVQIPLLHGYKSPDFGSFDIFEPQQNNNFTQRDVEVLNTDGSIQEKKDATFKYMKAQLGLSDAGAAALIGEWSRESNFNLKAENAAEKAGKNSAVKASQYGIGIGQWTGKRHDKFVNFINEQRDGDYSLKNQLDYAISEIKDNPELLNYLRNVDDPEIASACVYTMYVAAQEKNIENVEDLFNRRDKVIDKYKKLHNELYGKSNNGFKLSYDKAVDYLKSLTI